MPPPPKPRSVLGAVSTIIAVAALVLNSHLGATQHFNSIPTYAWPPSALGDHPWAWHGSMAAVFLIFGSIAVRSLATRIARIVHVGGGPAAGAAIRLIATVAGLILVLIVTIGMLGVSATKLFAAAGITGVIIGLAAQQSLGNVFAGIVLMVARPFTVGQRIRIRSGSFGGIFDGEVREMGLTYVQVMTEDDGLVRIPNLGMLAAAVGQAPPPKKDPAKKSLYVNRTMPKRPPRSTATSNGQRSQHQHSVRTSTHVPRDVIRRMRERRSEGGTDGGSPDGGGAGGSG